MEAIQCSDCSLVKDDHPTSSLPLTPPQTAQSASTSTSYDSREEDSKFDDTRPNVIPRKRNSEPKLFDYAPPPPASEDPEGWSRFLAAYRTGRWDLDVDQERRKELVGPLSSCEGVLNVVDTKGKPMTSKEYFATYKHLAAPRLSHERQRVRHEALLKHGLTHAHLRPSLQRYVELAKRLFDCDLATLSFASADERHIIFIAADGPPISQVPQCASICSHALLLEGESDIFVVPDMTKDWRFEHLFSEGGLHEQLGYRFHASAPIFLSSSQTPCCNIAMAPVHAGRFSIFGAKSRPNFDRQDAKLLLNLARMTEEAMENEYLSSFVVDSRTLNLESAKIFQALNQLAEKRADVISTNKSGVVEAIHAMSIQFSGFQQKTDQLSTIKQAKASEATSILQDSVSMSSIVEMVRKSVQASAVCMVDCSNVQIAQFLEIGTPVQSASAPSIVAFVGDDSLVPTIDQNEHLKSCFEVILSQDKQVLPQLFRRSATIRRDVEQTAGKCAYDVHFAAEGETNCCCSRTDRDVQDFLEPLLPLTVRTSFALPIFASDDVLQTRSPLAMMFILWATERPINTGEIEFCSTLCAHLASIAARDQASKVRRGQMDFMRTMQHELRTPLNGIAGITEALCDQIDDHMDNDAASHRWTRSGVGRRASSVSLGGSRVQDVASTSKLLVRQATQVLAPQLESIHISGMMLKTILDDILSFDSIFQSSAKIDLSTLDLGREIEDVCREEARYFALQELRTFRAASGVAATPLDQVDAQAIAFVKSMTASNEIPVSATKKIALVTPASLIVHIDKSVRCQRQSDKAKVRKIFSKLVNNALRFTPPYGKIVVRASVVTAGQAEDHALQAQKQGLIPKSSFQSSLSSRQSWVKVTISDTGSGMSDHFVAHKFLQPFNQADHFAQGIGLGATVACIFIQSLGGSFSVNSMLAKGTDISVCLPLIASTTEAANETQLDHSLLHKDALAPFSAEMVGFDVDEGTRAVQKVLTDHLKEIGVALIEKEKPIQTGLTFAHESAFVGDGALLPGAVGMEGTYTLVISRNPMNSPNESVERFFKDKEGLYAYLRPPFGPEMLLRLDNLLASMTTERRTHSEKVGFTSPFGPSSVPLQNDVFDQQSLAGLNSRRTSLAPEGISSSMSSLSIKTALSSAAPEASILVAPDQILQSPIVEGAERQPKDAFKILVVEDNPINMQLITSLLRKQKLPYVEACDGVEAVAQYKAYEPSVVLLDISLPLLDGFGACIAMRAHQLSFRPKIIAITALSTEEDRKRGLEVCGMDAWQTKPISIRTLRSDLTKWKAEWLSQLNGTEEGEGK